MLMKSYQMRRNDKFMMKEERKLSVEEVIWGDFTRPWISLTCSLELGMVDIEGDKKERARIWFTSSRCCLNP